MLAQLCATTNWNVTIPQGSTFQRVLHFADTDMTGLSLRGAIARRPGSAILCPYTFTVLANYALGMDIAVNGGFDTDTDWTKGAGVTIANGVSRSRLALLQAGLLDDVEAAISAIPDETQRRQAQINWEYADEIRRLDAWIAIFGGALNLDDAALDALFAAAGAL